MKPKSKMNTKPQDEINTVLCAVAPTPKLSTDAIAFEGAVVSRGNGIGATSKHLRQVDVFCERLDKIFEDGHPTKALIIDAFHKGNPNSLSLIDDCIHPLKELRFHSDSTVSCKICGYHSVTF